ncbi:hypothetical protein [Trujillonella endophytica]|uniref:Uncharacterized protein n=1 Tax=Trujillonella endophytica TaxID=673521 RepID=A0A1H8UTN0_9ACTN|nr:hypothetical protein [Trujillella endophytica]SEP06549.1 hypothetical protein SAMN05660991_03089 [Trujillella endophytica]
MPLTVAETCARIAAELNPPGQPFGYTCDGNRVLGTWDVADVGYSNLVAGGTIDKDYAITVTLDEGSGTYAVVERKSESETHGGLRGDGTIGFSGKKEAFRGRSVGKQWGGGAALRATSHGETGHTWSYSFETSRIKQPLFDLLASAGWEPERKGFLARLFSR